MYKTNRVGGVVKVESSFRMMISSITNGLYNSWEVDSNFIKVE